MQEIIFGNKETFAIRYKRGYKSEHRDFYYAHLHLILGGQIIGDSEEECFLLPWLASVKNINKKINNQFSRLENGEFLNRPDDEIFELIWKANGAINLEYENLPVLDKSVWSYCHLSIDETTDAWLITMTEDKGNIKFIWKGWREPCPIERIGKLFSVTVERKYVIDTIEDCIKNLEKEYPYTSST
jgi:hypothetical protein